MLPVKENWTSTLHAFMKILCLSVVDTKNIVLQPQELCFPLRCSQLFLLSLFNTCKPCPDHNDLFPS